MKKLLLISTVVAVSWVPAASADVRQGVTPNPWKNTDVRQVVTPNPWKGVSLTPNPWKSTDVRQAKLRPNPWKTIRADWTS